MMIENIQIRVYEIVGGDAAISSDDGSIIYRRIDDAISQGINVELDFINIEFITSTFLNAAIGQLYNKYNSEILNMRLQLKNISSEDLMMIKKVVARAKEYFKNKKQLNKIYENSLQNG